MSHEESDEHDEEHVEVYGDSGIVSKDAPIPRWLIWSYILLPIWGFISLYYFCNGSHGWLDRGYWNQLQKAALTTFPTENLEELKKPFE
jgi:hypothetical protein